MISFQYKFSTVLLSLLQIFPRFSAFTKEKFTNEKIKIIKNIFIISFCFKKFLQILSYFYFYYK